MKNISNNKIVIGVAGVVVGLVIGWFIGHAGSGSNYDSNSDKSANGNEKESQEVTSEVLGSNTGSKPMDALLTNNSSAEESESVIMVANQSAGKTATVGSVETDASTWVVVREDKNGVFGNILGATRVDSGASSNVAVELLRPTVAGMTYRVVLFKDNGDGAFNYKNDIPLTSGGVVISQPFKAI